MAIADYEKLLTAAGFEIVQGSTIEPKTRPWSARARRPLVTGQRQVDGATLEVQLQESYTNSRRGLSGVARVRRAGLAGEGSLRPRLAYGVLQSFLSGPWLALVFLLPLMCAGVWIVMLPGVFLIWLMTKALSRADPMHELPDLASPSLGWRYAVWGADAEAARLAWPTSRQDALVASKWFGWSDVAEGTVVLDSFIGWGRTDLFAKLISAAEVVARS
ncbi:MAG: hypothetical protein U0228_21015 [Myxococcaceae bacterium]